MVIRLMWVGMLLAGLAPTAAPAQAANPPPRAWLGTADTSWFNCANWSGQTCPSVSEVAIFNASSKLGVVITGPVTVAGLTLALGFQFTVDARAPATINGNAAIDGGTLKAPPLLTVTGNFEQSGGGKFVAGTGEVVMTGAAAKTIDATQAGLFNRLTIQGPGITTLARSLDVRGALTLAIGGTLDSAGNQLALAGDWQNMGGTFLAQTGTVLLNGGDQTLAGSTTFYNLTKTGSASKLTFPAGLTQTVAGLLNWQGASSTTPMLLRSSAAQSQPSPARQWFLAVPNTPVLVNLDVQDSVSMVMVITCTAGLDSGNNVRWNFLAPPTPTPTLTPPNTATPTATVTPTVTAIPTVTATPAIDPTPTSSLTPAPTDIPSLTFTPLPTRTPRPTITVTGTPPPTATPTITPTATASDTPTDTLTPTITATGTPTQPSPTPLFLYQAVTLTPPPADAVIAVVQSMDSTGGRLVCGLWEVLVAPGSVPGGSVWHCLTVDPQEEARLNVPAGHSRLWRVVNLSVTGPDGARLVAFTPPLTICAHYSEVFFHSAGNDPTRFKIFASPDQANQWADLSAVADQAVPRVCVQSGHLSDFQLLVQNPASASGLLGGLTRNFVLLAACGIVALALLVLLIVVMVWQRLKKKPAPAA